MEIWKDITGFPGYQVSNLGNVRSLERYKVKWNRYQYINIKYKGQMLKQRKLRGYLSVGMWKDKKMYNKTIHRLVALAFLPNPNNYPIINHKDGDKQNNNVENLEWCTFSHNTKEAYRLGLNHISNKHRESARTRGLASGKRVAQKDLSGNIIKIFNSGRQASIELGISQGNISQCCNGKMKSTCGFLWEYV